MPQQQTATNTATRLMKAKDAARFLGLSERTLWTLSELGKIPRVKMLKSVRYDLADLEAFITASKSV